ncbi:hypothetical protein HY494_01215 [Candidatus Woesearchaeota archaeon]|nr:hypothetical protein [Candidatus Woesearchaeota archaeon]
MKYDSKLVHQMLEVDRKNNILPEETLLKLARYYGKEEAWLAALNERSHGFFYRSSGKDLATLHSDICRDDAGEQLLLDEKSPGWLKKRRTLEAWLAYWNKIEDGRVMASAGDLYKSFKIIRKMREQGTSEEQAQAQRYLDSLREDFIWGGTEGGLVSSTRLFYSGKSLDARIVHHYRCRQPELTTENMLEVLVYQKTPIEKVASNETGFRCLRALFDTSDDEETIIQTAEFISSKRRENIVIWTAGWSGIDERGVYQKRAEEPERAVWFNIYTDRFYLDCYYSPICYYGRARGVRRESV